MPEVFKGATGLWFANKASNSRLQSVTTGGLFLPHYCNYLTDFLAQSLCTQLRRTRKSTWLLRVEMFNFLGQTVFHVIFFCLVFVILVVFISLEAFIASNYFATGKISCTRDLYLESKARISLCCSDSHHVVHTGPRLEHWKTTFPPLFWSPFNLKHSGKYFLRSLWEVAKSNDSDLMHLFFSLVEVKKWVQIPSLNASVWMY